MSDSREKLVKSLENIGEYFPDIKDSCLNGHYKIDTDRLSEMDEIIRCIKMYAILKDIKKLTGRKLEVLAYYLKFGYNKKTKKDVIRGIHLTDSNLNNINCELRKLKVINQIGYKASNNELNKELLEFKRFIVDGKGKYLHIKINS